MILISVYLIVNSRRKKSDNSFLWKSKKFNYKTLNKSVLILILAHGVPHVLINLIGKLVK